MKKILTCIIIGIMLTACSEENNSNPATIVDTQISIKYVNQNGENLFEIDKGYDLSHVDIYHKIDNEWVRYFEGNLDHPEGIKLVERENGTYFVVRPSTEIVKDNYSLTKIELSQSDSDTIRTEVDKSNSNVIATKVSYNGELKWEGPDERMFTIVK